MTAMREITVGVAGGPLRVVAGLIDRPPLSMIALARHLLVPRVSAYDVAVVGGGPVGLWLAAAGSRTAGWPRAPRCPLRISPCWRTGLT
jgi:hypothetical protein